MEVSQLPVGTLVESRDGTFAYYVASQDQPGYPGTTLLSRDVVLIGAFDGAEPDNPRKRHPRDRAHFGSNDLAASNVLQWLNSDKTDWYAPATEWDKPPESAYIRNGARGYRDLAGYLTSLPGPVRENLLESSVPVHVSGADGSPALDYVTAKVFLPSRTEMGLGDDYGLPEGEPLPLLRDRRFLSANLTEQAASRYSGPWQPQFPMKAGSIWRYWLRSPHLHYTYLVRYVAEMGGLSFTKANYEIVGIRPMMNVRGELPVESGIRNGNRCYLEELP